MSDLRPFLRLQSDAWLTSLREKLAEDLLANARTTSFAYVGKSGTTQAEVSTEDLAAALADVLAEKDIDGAASTVAVRMTVARFE